MGFDVEVMLSESSSLVEISKELDPKYHVLYIFYIKFLLLYQIILEWK